VDRKKALEQLCEKYRVDFLYAFGSRAREVKEWVDGERESLASGPSDVDIGVKYAGGFRPSVREKVELAIELEDFFSRLFR